MSNEAGSGEDKRAGEPRWRTDRGSTPASLPAHRASTTDRFFGGNPAAVLLRLVLLSVVVGVVFAVFGFDPRDLAFALTDLVRAVVENSADLVQALVRYFLLGAAIVFPIWLIVRLIGMATRR